MLPRTLYIRASKWPAHYCSLQGKVNWALAGRDRVKLEGVREDLARINPECAKVPIILANADDAESVAAMAAQAQVRCLLFFSCFRCFFAMINRFGGVNGVPSAGALFVCFLLLF